MANFLEPSSKQSAHTCEKCGYDLSGTPHRPCPECGTTPTLNARFAAQRAAYQRSWKWLGLTFVPPLAWIIVLNVLYICGRLATGEWPGPWNNPSPTPFLGACFRGMGHVYFAMPILMSVLPGIVWLRHARAIETLNPSDDIGANQLSALVWGWVAGVCVCWLCLWGDPLGAFSWFID